MKIRRIISSVAISTVLLLLVLKTEASTEAVVSSLELCVTAVIPALFPFFVISGLLVNLGIVAVLGKILYPFSKLLFKTSGQGAVAFLIGILCGYPTGAKVIADLYKMGTFSKKEAERLLAFCNNSGPLFVIGTVGSIMLKNHSLGVVLYAIHVISAILTGVILCKGAKEKNSRSNEEIIVITIGKAISQSIENAVKSILTVCGYVVFFGVLCELIDNQYITVILEVTQGAKEIVNQNLSQDSVLILLSGIIGFGGICVLFQVQSAVSETGLSTRTYLIGKMIQAFISMVITFLYVKLFELTPTFSQPILQHKPHYVIIVLFVICAVYTVIGLTKKLRCDIFFLRKSKEQKNV